MTSTPAVVSPEASRHSTHFITQTLLGPVCNHQNCKTKVATKGGLFTVSRQSIIRHWTANKCYTGSRQPNARALVRHLEEQRIHLHGRIARNRVSTDALIDKYISPHLTEVFTSGSCGRCGYVNNPGRVQREHISSNKNPSTMPDLKRKREI